MSKKKKKGLIAVIAVVFLVYCFGAARPVPRETILAPKWINSLDTEDPILLGKADSQNQIFPFTLGYRFGYIDTSGQFALNRIKNGDIYLGSNMWTEHPPEPSVIEIKNIEDETIINIDNPRGYPVLLDDRVFILGSEQNSLSEIDRNGNVIWTYEFGSILIDMDVAAGLVVTASIDGVIEILNSRGERVYFFQPGGSRIEAIYGCAISREGSRIGIISGYDPQRFLLLEKFGVEDSGYRVVFHEFLGKGFRRPVRVLFIDEDRRVVYEREGGINYFNIRSHRSIFIPLEGEVTAIEKSGDNRMLFLITKRMYQPMQKDLIGIKLSGERGFSVFQSGSSSPVFLRALFNSEDVYLDRLQTGSGSVLITGGGDALISFDLEKK
jgi:hypothetical protein